MNAPLESLFPANIPTDSTSIKPKHAGGRPRLWTEQRALQLVDELYQWLDSDATNITLELGLRSLGHKPWLLSNIASDNTGYTRFPQAVQSLKEFVHAKVSDGALKGALNARFSQFYLGHNARWSTQVNSNTSLSGQVAVQHSGGLTVNFVVQGDATCAPQQI